MGITEPSQEYFKDGGWHWTGSIWIKGGLAFEYAGQIAGLVSVADATAGTNTMVGDAVAADEIWVIAALMAKNADSAVTGALLGLQKGGINYYAAATGVLDAAVGFSWAGNIYLIEDDKPVGRLRGCTVNDALLFQYFGYKMRLT